jgi:hypothetical protein
VAVRCLDLEDVPCVLGEKFTNTLYCFYDRLDPMQRRHMTSLIPRPLIPPELDDAQYTLLYSTRCPIEQLRSPDN